MKENEEVEEIEELNEAEKGLPETNIIEDEKDEKNQEEAKKEEVIVEEKDLKQESQEEVNQEVNDEFEKTKGEEKKKRKFSIKAAIIITLLIIILLLISTIFAIVNINNSNIIKGVYIEGVNLSDLSKEEATNLINDRLNKIENIELNYGEYSTIIKLEDLGLEIDAKTAINDAINLGKTNNIIIDNYSILKTNILKTKLEIDIKTDEEKFSKAIKNIQAEIPESIKEYSYEIEKDKLIITNGKSGKAIDKEMLKGKIIANIKEQFNGNIKEIDIPMYTAEPEEIDIEKIYNEIKKEAKNAYIIEEPFELHKEEDGIDFAITLNEAKELLKEQKETYTIPLKITEPKVKIKDLGDKLFKKTLSKYTTIYDAGNTNRAHNVALAAKTLNGTILLPGETFSYNGTLGNTNKEKGYKQASAYAGGKVVQSYGGGICQVSSTLYNAILYANLEVVERYNHSYTVSYVPAGRDATVAYGGKDFKFKNSRSYPIKIVANAKNGVISISIAGIEEEKEYEIVLTSTVLSTKARSTVYQNNSQLEEGKQKVIQNGYDGKTSIAYKTVKYNGKTISKTVLSKDTYKPMNKIVEVGTKKVTNNTTGTTTPTNTSPSTTTSTNNKPTNTTTQTNTAGSVNTKNNVTTNNKTN